MISIINKSKYQYYFFSNELNKNIIKNILKVKNISYVYTSEEHKHDNVYTIRNFCKKNHINFIISNNINLAIKIKANGIYIPANDRHNSIKYKRFNEIIGTAHNQLDFFFKERQKCKKIFLSPLFHNPKYSSNKIIGTVRFNLISLNWKLKKLALGGINNKNIKKIDSINGITGFGFRRLFD